MLGSVGPVFPANFGQSEKFVESFDPDSVEKVAFRSSEVWYGPVDEVFERLGLPEILAKDRKERNLGAPSLGHRPISDFAHDSAGCPNEVGEMQARAVRKKDEVFSPFETGEVSGDYEMEIRSAFELVEEGKVLRYAAGGDEQVAAIGGEAEPIENPCGGFSEVTEDGGHERAVFDSFADGLGLNAQVGGVEEFVKPLDEGGEAGFFVQVGSVNPVPGKVFHENGGNIEFLAEHESEGGDVAKDEVGLRFPEGFSGFFEGRFVESKEALEPGDGLVEVMLEGGFLDESDVGFEPVGVEGHLGGKVFRPEPVGQGAKYPDDQPGLVLGEGSQDSDCPGRVSESVRGCETG